MRIPKPKQDCSQETEVLDDLERLVQQPLASASPPCPSCRNFRPGSCSARCADAPRALSIEPDRYPIETSVVPIVYELNVLRLVQTCWSCEGHMDAEGNLWKVPQVSFYSASPVFVQLLAARIAGLRQAKQLGYEWHIAFSSYGDSSVPTYTLEPRFRPTDEARLGVLQQDLKVIGENLSIEIRRAASELLSQLS